MIMVDDDDNHDDYDDDDDDDDDAILNQPSMGGSTCSTATVACAGESDTSEDSPRSDNVLSTAMLT